MSRDLNNHRENPGNTRTSEPSFEETSDFGDTPKKAPLIGVPYRTLNEQLNSTREAYERYVSALTRSGARAVEIPLNLEESELRRVAEGLDGFVLPGGPADVEPTRYGAARHPQCAYADAARERTDNALLANAFAEHKPVLGICYGLQSLNVYLGGSLIQDIGTECETKIEHRWSDSDKNPEPFHGVKIEAGSRLARIEEAAGGEGAAGHGEARVNSSHHQSILEPAKGLRVTAHGPDGIVEAVEWTGDEDWVTAVQWHPERNMDDSLSRALFQEFVAAARAYQQAHNPVTSAAQ